MSTYRYCNRHEVWVEDGTIHPDWDTNTPCPMFGPFPVEVIKRMMATRTQPGWVLSSPPWLYWCSACDEVYVSSTPTITTADEWTSCPKCDGSGLCHRIPAGFRSFPVKKTEAEKPVLYHRRCPDDGTCHHQCEPMTCYRVLHAEPLSGVFDQDTWPAWAMATYGGDEAGIGAMETRTLYVSAESSEAEIMARLRAVLGEPDHITPLPHGDERGYLTSTEPRVLEALARLGDALVAFVGRHVRAWRDMVE